MPVNNNFAWLEYIVKTTTVSTFTIFYYLHENAFTKVFFVLFERLLRL